MGRNAECGEMALRFPEGFHLRRGDARRLDVADGEGFGLPFGEALGLGGVEKHLALGAAPDTPIYGEAGLPSVGVFVDADGDGPCLDGAPARLFPGGFRCMEFHAAYMQVNLFVVSR